MHQVAKTEGEKKGETMGEPGETQESGRRRPTGEEERTKVEASSVEMTSDEVVSVLYGKQHHSGHRRLSLQLGVAESDRCMEFEREKRREDGGATHGLIGPYKAGGMGWIIFRVWRKFQVAPSLERRFFCFSDGARMIEQISSDWSAGLGCGREESQRLAG
ncbi:hypothetical protein ASPSYDRAFT_36713 [Aspergillus sydowii CBS 593.65]|uniref:Uncharacterized protein n=1 Tax=Aspergillus sydowii CBS 593.65 TaxID=1036612 RepID=A0A1L9T171_9EURO|nr:uncharacterized protein ASPSYDRAFT_36713 [Aspergillus sydowii CBS 593.65]OJJ53159.1 hypothetical protein ASPSYDRAFT_36713 [Aspergillus sydowii CBS 593.65]